MYLYILFLLQIFVIYLVSQKTIQTMFNAFFRMTKNPHISGYLVALIYFPGTLLHELSHFLTAVALILPVESLNLLPSVNKQEGRDRYYLKLGSVTFGHKDYLRTMLVGIAPIFAGLAFFYIIFGKHILPNENVWINVLLVYLISVISSSMFSSKKDLEGALILIPLLLLIASLLIGFKVDLGTILFSEGGLHFIKNLNLYIASATIANLLIYAILKFFRI